MNSLFIYVPQTSYECECLIHIRQIAPHILPTITQDKQYAILNCFITLSNTQQYECANYLIPIAQYMDEILFLQKLIKEKQNKQKTGAGRSSK